MRVKKFYGSTLAEAVERVKQEMGPEAIILQTRRVRPPGLLAWVRRRSMVEVTAAVAGEPAAAAPADAVAARPPAPAGVGGSPRGDRPEPPGADPFAALAKTALSEAPHTSHRASDGERSTQVPQIAADVQQVKEMVAAIWRQVQATREVLEDPVPPLYPEDLDPIYRALVQSEVEPSLARCVTDALLENGEGKGEGLLRQEALGMLERLLGPGRPIELNGRCRVVALVGPTGAGKTTTLAKLAAHYALGMRKKVALITLDTFRVGAIEQLRAYAEIAGLPNYVAGNPEEMVAILDRLRDRDLVLVDTAGRNARDEMRMSELNAFWTARRPDEVHLVLSVTTRYSDALEVIERHRNTGFDRLLFTKLDETVRHGLLLNLSVVAQRPISYVTTGQNVPEDIAAARAGDLAKLIL